MNKMEDAWGNGNQSETRFTSIATNKQGSGCFPGDKTRVKREWEWERMKSVRGERDRERDRWKGLGERELVEG